MQDLFLKRKRSGVKAVLRHLEPPAGHRWFPEQRFDCGRREFDVVNIEANAVRNNIVKVGVGAEHRWDPEDDVHAESIKAIAATLVAGAVFCSGAVPALPGAESTVASLVATPSQAESDRTAAQAAFGRSLSFRSERRIVDQTHATIGWLAQHRAAPYTSKEALRLTLAIYSRGQEPKLVRNLGEVLVFSGNLAEHPRPIDVNLRGVADGDYEYHATIREGESVLAALRAPVMLVAELDQNHANVERRLARIDGHDSAKASIRYPFDLARTINLGKRMLESNNRAPEFGLTQAGEQVRYDFAAGMKASMGLLAALEAGKDPVWRAGGERVRHYYMPEADEILPYHVFVPSTWDGRARLPLMFVLHGNTRDQDFYFDRDGRILPTLAERHGYLVVAPLGYWPNGGYNYVSYGRENAGQRGLLGASKMAQTFGEASADPGANAVAAQGFGGVNGSVTPALVRAEWSEQDVMHVFDLVKAEYPIDSSRVFLFGYSAGGQGAHYLGPKFADYWAGIAIGGSNATAGDSYPYDRLKNIPVMIFCGTNDTANLSRSRAMAAALQQQAVRAELKEYEGATHDSAPSAAIADIFAFFNRITRK
jgi:poly(3-hydroxybutyrate) depolymerase